MNMGKVFLFLSTFLYFPSPFPPFPILKKKRNLEINCSSNFFFVLNHKLLNHNFSSRNIDDLTYSLF